MDRERTTDTTELSESPTAVADARCILRTVSGDLATPDTLTRAELALSEIVTNALTHGAPPVGLRVTVDPGRITVSVTDAGHAPMHLHDATLDDGHGRGLAIVAAVATAWGWERPAAGGRTVWFTVASPHAALLPGLVPCA